MKVNIILVDELGDEVIARTIDAKQVEALGEYLDDFVILQINKVLEEYPECRNVYREDVKSYGEQRADQWEEIYKEELEWALAHEDEIDNMDPEEYAHDRANSYFDNPYGFGY